MKINKIEAILICSGPNAWKFLKLTIPHNSQFFDHIIVVGQKSDEEELLKLNQENITCITSDLFTKDGFKFNKGAGYNEGLKHLKYKDWVCFIDCDVIIPNSFSKIKNNYDFNNEFAYGMRRVLLPKLSDCYKAFNDGININNYNIPYGIGYGYFLLINWNSNPIKNQIDNNLPIYPDKIDGVGESDWMFRNRWGETNYGEKEYIGNLIELPMLVLHLGDCLSKTGKPSEEFWE